MQELLKAPLPLLPDSLKHAVGLIKPEETRLTVGEVASHPNRNCLFLRALGEIPSTEGDVLGRKAL